MSGPLTLETARLYLFRVMRDAERRRVERVIVDDDPLTPADERRARELAAEYDLPALLRRGSGVR